MLYIFVSIYVFMTFKHMFSLNKKKQKTRATVFVFCTLCYDALHLCEVSLKYLDWFSTYRVHNKNGYF